MSHRRASLRSLGGLIALVIVSALPVAAGPLPGLAVSLPSDLPAADAVRVVREYGGQDVMIVLPPVLARVGGTNTPEVAAGAPAPLMPPSGGVRFYAYLRLEIGDVPAAGRGREGAIERQVADILARVDPARSGIAGLVIEPTATPSSLDVLQFVLATLMVKARGLAPSLQIALVLPPDVLAQPGDTVARMVAYADSLVVGAGTATGNGDARIGALAAGKPIVLRAGAGAAGAATAFLDLLMAPGTAAAATVWIETADRAGLKAVCASARFLSRSLDGGFEMTAPERAPAAVLADGRPVSPAVAFVGSRTADMAILLGPGASRATLRVLTLAAAPGRTPQVTCFDALDGRRLETSGGGAQAPACRSDAGYVLFQARVGAQSDRVFEAVNVTGRSSMRVEEIIARWQASREAERQVLDNYVVPCFLSLHFEAASIETSVDVALDLQQFVDRSGTQDWVQTSFLVNGVRLKKGQEFPLPQLEPEKVVTRPLELRLDEKYTYELVGTETVNGRVCYVVSIVPGRGSESLYSGRVWIDGTTFRQVRLRLEQRDGRNNVAAHVETQEFDQVGDAAGHAFTLVRSIYAQDAVSLAGRSITLEKHYRFGEYAINTAAFATRLAAARSGDDPMFRNTDEGLRALRKQGQDRVVQPVADKRVFAGVGGVLYDGAYSFPIPLAGVSWVDFDFRHTGTQLSTFFAGPFLASNLSGRITRSLRWGFDLVLDALPSKYYQYSGNTELTDRQVRNFEQSAGGLLNWQATPDLNLSTQGNVYYEIYQATGVTDPAYRLPPSGLTLDWFGEAKYVRHGFTAVGTVNQDQRLGWHGFGLPTEPAPRTSSTFTKYSAEVSQHVFVGKLTRGGVSASYFGGRNLDRFSQYSPSFLSKPTMKGIPEGVDSFDQVTTLSAYYGFNVMDLAKLEGSYGHSWTRNKDEGNGLRQFDGLDLTLGVAGPFGTFVQGSISCAIRGNLERYTSRWGVYLVFLKPLRR